MWPKLSACRQEATNVVARSCGIRFFFGWPTFACALCCHFTPQQAEHASDSNAFSCCGYPGNCKRYGHESGVNESVYSLCWMNKRGRGGAQWLLQVLACGGAEEANSCTHNAAARGAHGGEIGTPTRTYSSCRVVTEIGASYNYRLYWEYVTRHRVEG